VPKIDPTADVLAVLSKQYPFEPFGSLPRTYHVTLPGSPFSHYLVLSADGQRGFFTAFKEAGRDEKVVTRLFQTLLDRIDEALAVQVVTSFPLAEPISHFDHLIVCAPALEMSTEADYLLCRSLFRAFPGFGNEFIGDETIAQADARCDFIQYSDLQRQPSPVIDMRYDIRYKRRARSKGNNLLVHREKNLWWTVDRFCQGQPQSWFELRNHRGQTVKFVQQDGIIEKGTDRCSAIDEEQLRSRVKSFLWKER
jgi:hypothetical protein